MQNLIVKGIWFVTNGGGIEVLEEVGNNALSDGSKVLLAFLAVMGLVGIGTFALNADKGKAILISVLIGIVLTFLIVGGILMGIANDLIG